ncbi:MAG: hypothetical protein KA982_00405 [Clostridia bacterium]|nr:hypothetical protein [Clostridia bacterium]
MKQKKIAVIITVLLLCSITLLVLADVCHHDFVFKSHSSLYVFYDDEYCTEYHTDYYECTICGGILEMEYDLGEKPHSFGPPVFVGYTSDGEWWYHDCINCGGRVDFFE